MEDTINIVFVTDENYFKYMLVTIESILENASGSYKICCFILDLGISLDNLKLLKNKYKNQDNIEFKFIHVDNTNLSKYKIKTHVSTAAYAKIYISDLIDVNKVIYLDCDLILNDDILNLWNEFDENVLIKAVWNPFYNYDNEYLGLRPNDRTFNNGVILLNLDLMRKNDSSKQLKDFLEKYHEKTKLHDQAAFNAVFKNDWVELDLKWNYQVSLINNYHKKLNLEKNEYFNLYKKPSIIHFTSNSKPWKFRNSHPYKRLYIEYYKKVFGKVDYNDYNIKSLLQKMREAFRYKYYYFVNII